MRLRSWLLAGTGLAALAMLPASAYAQQAEYQALLDAQATGDAAAVDAAQQALTEACITANFANLDECIAAIEAGQFGLEQAPPPADQPPADQPPAEEQTPPPAEEQAPPPAEEPTPPAAEEQTPPPAEEQAPPPAEEQPTADDAQQQFLTDLQTALNDYQAALNQAAGGDYEGGKAAAADAESRALALCQANGYADIASCIGQPLPPLPEPPAAQPEQPAEQQSETPPAAEEQTPPAEEQQAPAETDPQAEALAHLQQAAELYTVGAGQLDAGDPAGQSTVDAANSQFAQICAELGVPDVAQCLAQYGITLPPLPATPVQPTEPQGTPISELPGSEEQVTPDATEVLPETQSGGEAAPILDSAKDTQSSGEAPPAEQQSTEPPAPPPTSDKDAQSALAPSEFVPIEEASGEKVEAAALPPIVVPPSVTIINNTIINNTNITNNNAPAQPPKPGNKPDYANNGFIFNIGVNLVISNPASDFDRITDDDEDFVYYERLPGGRIKETVERPNGVKVVTIRNRYGEILKRSRITPDGREYILAYYDDEDDEDDFFNWRDPGDDLPPLRLTIPIREYILDADEADEDEVELFFRQPPVEKVRQIYTIDDVKRSARLRDSVRRIEVGGLTFDSGKATIAPTQVGALSKVANAMLRLLEDNPAETFLIEGHTDAVGPDEKNLVLSDARASTVARILTDFYGIPPENLVTQGYGERYLKVKTELAERLNRRVSIKRITSLITVSDRD